MQGQVVAGVAVVQLTVPRRGDLRETINPPTTSREEDRMPHRSVALLEGWVSEFVSSTNGAEAIRVLPLAGESGDVGLIIVALPEGPTAALIEPTDVADPRWRIRFEAHDAETTLTGTQMRAVARGLAVCADLCDFIERKSAYYLSSIA